jgi:hypothetical protein
VPQRLHVLRFANVRRHIHINILDELVVSLLKIVDDELSLRGNPLKKRGLCRRALLLNFLILGNDFAALSVHRARCPRGHKWRRRSPSAGYPSIRTLEPLVFTQGFSVASKRLIINSSPRENGPWSH